MVDTDGVEPSCELYQSSIVTVGSRIHENMTTRIAKILLCDRHIEISFEMVSVRPASSTQRVEWTRHYPLVVLMPSRNPSRDQ